MELDLQLDLEDPVAKEPVGFRLRGLRLQGVVAAPHFIEDALDVAHILLGLLELPLGLLTAHAEARDSRRLLEHGAALLGLLRQQLIDLALLHDRVGRLADAGVEKQLPHLAQLHGIAVDEVLALARAIQPAPDGNLRQVEGEDLVLVGKQEGDLRDVQCLARLAAGEDDVLHVLRAKGFRRLLAEDPFHRVNDIALPAPVGP
jgi:hypothetical protein